MIKIFRIIPQDSEGELRVLHCSVHGLVGENKIDEFNLFLVNLICKSTILCITKHWMKKENL